MSSGPEFGLAVMYLYMQEEKQSSQRTLGSHPRM
jgi:hypothetical protein